MVLKAYPFLKPERTALVPHVFDPALYPSRPKHRSEKVTLRFLGTLFSRRTPLPIFLALGSLMHRRPDLRDALRIELVGFVEPGMLEGPAAASLPCGMVGHRPPVPYLESLELMYDADILLLIEADVASTPFVPSKLTDYMGANTPIVAIAPEGGCRDILGRLGCPTVDPKNIDGIASALETAIDRVIRGASGTWCNEEFRQSFGFRSAAAVFATLLRSSPI